MAFEEATLKANLKTDIQAIHTLCQSNAGMTPDTYADKLAEAIAKRVLAHIASNGEVSITSFTATAGPYPVLGTAKGTIA